MQIERLNGVKTIVGESPLWDSATSSLWLIDILGPSIIRVSADGDVDSWRTPTQIGAVALTNTSELAVALAEGFAFFDPASGRFGPVDVAGCRPGGVLSEGKVDRQGRMLASSGDSAFREPVGALHRWDGHTVEILDDGFILGNGLCFGLGGDVLYAADSLKGVIYAYDYGSERGGAATGRRVHYTWAGEHGFPDGATVDAEGFLWTVIHGSPWLIRLDPDGREAVRLEMPTTNCCSVTFGGVDLDELFVTTLDPSRIEGVAPDASRAGHEAGVVYRVRDTGFRGVSEPRMSMRF